MSLEIALKGFDLIAKQSTGEEMLDFQPIETAPKDGTPVLLYSHHEPQPDDLILAYWAGSGWDLCGHFNYSCYDRSGFDRDFEPTHWAFVPYFSRKALGDA